MSISQKQSIESYFQNYNNKFNGEKIENMTVKQNQTDSIDQVLKDLSNRLALLTIYRDVERDIQQSGAILINENISLFANYQTLLQEKNGLAIGLQKFTIKHINTTSATNSQFFYESKLMENNQLLQKYVIEAADKQAEGIVNNVLIMIQPTQNGEEKQKNLFSYAIACQIQESKKVGFGKEKKKENKVVFINLTGRDSQQNLNNWNDILSGEEDYLYFSFIKMGDIQKMESEFLKNFYAMNFPDCKQFIFPYVCDENEKLMKGDYIRSLFDLFLYNKIQKQTQLDYIALSLEISDDIEYELNGLQYLIQTLMKLSNDKLIVHINVRKNCQDQNFEVKLAQGMNQCYIAFLTDQLSLDKNMTIDEKLLLAKYLDQTSMFYKKMNLDFEYCGLMQRQRANLLSSANAKINSYNQYQVNKEQDAIFYKINDNQTAIIIPKIGEHRLTKQTEIYIDYNDEIIIIYYNQNHKGKGAYLFYAEVKREIFNQIELNYELQFTEIALDFDEINTLVHPILFYKQQCIYIMYGLRNDSLNEILYKYSLSQKDWKSLIYQDKQYKFDFISQKILPEPRSEYIKKIENRARPTVCFDGKQNSQNICAILFGGENIKSFQIMNLTEFVEISETSYYCILIGKQNLFKDLSFKPFSHQLILQAQKESTSYFLFLNGNNDLSLRKENSITNYLINDQAILFTKSSNHAQFQKLTVQYLDEHYFKIDKLNNIQQNIKFITTLGDLFFWRVIFLEDITDDSSYSELIKLLLYQKSKVKKANSITETEVIKLLLQMCGSQEKFEQMKQNMEEENTKREQFVIQKYKMIYQEQSNFGLLKLQTLKTKIAFENYICFDSKKQKIYIKQYQYSLLDSIKGQINDFEENELLSPTNSQSMSAIFISQNQNTDSVSNIQYGTIEIFEKKSQNKKEIL